MSDGCGGTRVKMPLVPQTLQKTVRLRRSSVKVWCPGKPGSRIPATVLCTTWRCCSSRRVFEMGACPLLGGPLFMAPINWLLLSSSPCKCCAVCLGLK